MGTEQSVGDRCIEHIWTGRICCQGEHYLWRVVGQAVAPGSRQMDMCFICGGYVASRWNHPGAKRAQRVHSEGCLSLEDVSWRFGHTAFIATGMSERHATILSTIWRRTS